MFSVAITVSLNSSAVSAVCLSVQARRPKGLRASKVTVLKNAVPGSGIPRAGPFLTANPKATPTPALSRGRGSARVKVGHPSIKIQSRLPGKTMESTGVSVLIRGVRPHLLGSRSQRHPERSRELARRHRSNRGFGPPGAPSSAERFRPGCAERKMTAGSWNALRRRRPSGKRGAFFVPGTPNERNVHEWTARGDDRPAWRSVPRPHHEGPGRPDLPDDVVRVRRHPARRRSVRAQGDGEHLHAGS